jgi:UDP-N-acetylglucosamine--N-acetylmuramyl-(pentapeptide) pyrophosphoryl-undecaprenol N-acetylglucosamine transferase
VRALDRSASVFYVGTARGLEAKVLPARGDDLELLDVAPLRGGGVKGFLRGVYRAAATLPAARRLVRRRKPDVVLSVGGYAAGPIAIAARAMGVPLAILEPNGVLGLSNRLLAPFIHRAYTGFGDLDAKLDREKIRKFGVPLRSAFSRTPYSARADRFRVLVLGGSLGAAGLNAALPEAIAILRASIPFATILHQTGRGRAEATREDYRARGLDGVATVVEFIDDVAGALGDADVVIQRAGASSLAELCVVGRASVLVPFPFAADQHQLANARSLEAAGASRAIEQTEATAERLARELTDLARNPDGRTRMAERAASLGRPRAANDIA